MEFYEGRVVSMLIPSKRDVKTNLLNIYKSVKTYLLKINKKGWGTLGILVFALVYIAIGPNNWMSFIVRTFYFDRKADLYIREIHLSASGNKTYIVFEKDDELKHSLSPLYAFKGFPADQNKEKERKEFVDKLQKLKYKKSDNKLLILAPIDIGFIPKFMSPILFKTVFELKPVGSTAENMPLYDIDIRDLDGDGTSELIATWVFLGGSGGTQVPVVIGEDNGNFKVFDGFPLREIITAKSVEDEKRLLAHAEHMFSTESEKLEFDRDLKRKTTLIDMNKEVFKQYGHLIYEPEEHCQFKCNGKIVSLPVNSIHTDIFSQLVDINDDGKIELVMAYPHRDGDCHFCPQSWTVIAYKFIGKKFVEDPNIDFLYINKSSGIGLNNVHGYQRASLMGVISYFLAPSWLNVPEHDDARNKARYDSIIIQNLQRKRTNAKSPKA